MSPEKDSLASGAAAPKEGDVAGDPEDTINWQEKAEEFERDLETASQNIDTLKTEQDRNIRRIQGTLQSQINARTAETDTDRKRWEDAYHEEKMSGMEEAEALRYDNSRMATELAEAETVATGLRAQAAEAQAKNNYISHFMGLGVDLPSLNTQGSLQELSDSGYVALDIIRTDEKSQLTETREALKAQTLEIETLKNAADPNKLAESLGDKTPDRVATHTHGDAGASDRTWDDAFKEATVKTGRPVTEEEEVWRLVEQKVLPSTIIPGLEDKPQE